MSEQSNNKTEDVSYTLMNLAIYGDKEGLQAKLKGGADINSLGEDGQSALYRLAKIGHLAAANLLLNCTAGELLINNGCDPDQLNGPGDDADLTPIEASFLNNNLKFAEMLLQNNADPNYVCPEQAGNESLLCFAATINRPGAISLLLRYGADLTLTKNQSALPAAIKLGYFESVRVLMDAGLRPDRTDQKTIDAMAAAGDPIRQLIAAYENADNAAELAQQSGNGTPRKRLFI